MSRIFSIRRAAPCVAAICLAVAAVVALPAQEKPDTPSENYVKAHYTKYEYRIPMRDGVRLFTSVYVPKDQSQPWPFMVDRTPYSVAPYGEDQYKEKLGPSDEFEKAGYIFVYQDVRGRYMSEGKFLEMTPHIDDKKSKTDVDDSSDMSDTVDWLLAHVPNNNGKVGIWGISYPGFYTSASIIDSNPAIKAASPQAPMTNLFEGDDAYHGGAFMLSANFGFYTFFKPFDEPMTPAQESQNRFDFGTPDSYEFYLKATPTSLLDTRDLKGSNPLFSDQLYHTTFDNYWKVRDLAPHMHNVHCAVMTVGGWYDAEDLSGPWRTYRSIEKRNPGTSNTIVEGPWVHGGWARGDGDHLGDIPFNAKTSEFFRKEIQFPFFEYYLKGKGEAPPEAYMFETGTNVWRKYASWPPPGAQPKMLYFHGDGKLSFEAPSGDAGKGYDEYVSDPMHPVPFVPYVTDTVPQRYMVEDQRFASTRPDVLVYETDPLTEDVTIAGPIITEAEDRFERHGFGFRCKADRCLSERLSRSGRDEFGQQAHPECAAVAHGRLPGAAARRADAGQVSQQLGKAGASDTGEGDGSRIRDAGPEPHLPQGPPHHGAGAELVVSPDRPQPADIHRYPAREA